MKELVTEELLKKIDNRFLLSVVAAKRARQLNDGAVPLIERKEDEPNLLVALAEIMEDKIKSEVVEAEEEKPKLIEKKK